MKTAFRTYGARLFVESERNLSGYGIIEVPLNMAFLAHPVTGFSVGAFYHPVMPTGFR